ncbi:MAG TPA: SIS domain-containing protein [Acidimicrobiales bacterium]|nr:SIS domain-containing protein [Acidimicrobiales bacterium]
MCGIIAVLRRDRERAVPAGADLVDPLDGAWERFSSEEGGLLVAITAAADAVADVDAKLRGTAGALALIGVEGLGSAVAERIGRFEARIRDLEIALDAGRVAEGDLEAVNAALVRLKDATWAVGHDRLGSVAAVRDLAGDAHSEPAVAAYLSVQIALAAIDRLEVRGRDSAGLHLLVDGHGLDVSAPEIVAEVERRSDPLFRGGSVRVEGGCLGFVYKAAAEIGELGDNTAVLRAAIRGDALLRRAVSAPAASVTVLGHTRWASVGIISEPNTHPLDSAEAGADRAPYVVAALNGDVDNYLDLKTAERLRIAPEITTDAKVIPTLVAREVLAGADVDDAFRRTVARFDGSVAIAASSAVDPGALELALRGSGQALCIGLAEDAFVVASEPYGLVEVADTYLRMEGEAPSGRDGSAGQVVVIRRDGAGTIAGIRRVAYDGTELPVTEDDLAHAEITTRDIDRGGAPHFLLKEIGEAPQSVRKTLRGKLEERHGLLAVRLPSATLPPAVETALAAGRIRRVIVTGQGTAAVAGQAVAAFFEDAFGPALASVRAMPATELSGFGLVDDMSDTLVVAISQSGTTTDTNRTVDLARGRGALVVGIVNRRNSDLVEKSAGVLYTSDGRDVEMAVPSTKAFYAQVIAGALLAWGFAAMAGAGDRHRGAEVLEGLRRLPDAMERVLATRDRIAAAAARQGPPRRYWAVVGNGPNKVAAAELRIKLSELCYKAIPCDATEDKKHIDLSSEPMIVVCAAGLAGANADDVAKEVAIFRAHKAAPVVIASEGESRFEAAVELLEVPAVHPDLDFVLTAMAGHLFGYEAAVAIDAQARFLREIRGAVEANVTDGGDPHELYQRLVTDVTPLADRFFAELRSGALDGHLEASTAVRLASLLRYGRGSVPLDAYELEYGKVGSPEALVDDLLDALSDGIDELTRPVDAIKHQAKTVTVGISRSEDSYSKVPLVAEVLAAGASRERVGYRALRTLVELDAAVVEVTGWSRYTVDGDVAAGTATIQRIDSGGIARDLPSRTDRDPSLKGTKRRAAFEREVTVSRGARDGRTIVIVPETKDSQVTGITLMHVRFADRLDASTARRVLTGYRNRYNAIVDAVTETEPSFRDDLLDDVDLVDLLVEPVHVLARRWRSS